MNEQEFNRINAEKLSDIIGVDGTATTVARLDDVVVDVQIKHLCPHCGTSYYMEKGSICTLVYYPPIYKDGVNINPDRNKTTTYCTCMNCGKDFSFTR